jgi:hypothetical protein
MTIDETQLVPPPDRWVRAQPGEGYWAITERLGFDDSRPGFTEAFNILQAANAGGALWAGSYVIVPPDMPPLNTAPDDEPPAEEPPAEEPPEPPAEEPPGEPAVAGTMWVDVSTLPATGAAWDRMNAAASASWKAPNLADQNNQADISVLAGALVAARKGDPSMRNKVVKAIVTAVGTEGDRTLALGRQITGYVLAADLIGYRTPAFEDWLADLRHQTIGSKTLISTHEDRPNNWGTHAGMARVADAIYLGDTDDLARAATVFRGWLGDRDAYDGFDYDDDLSWHSDPSHPVGINPKGATIEGHDVDGVLPDDQRRTGGFSWPAPKGEYPWEAMQGAVATATLLERNGYPDVWQWSDAAILRAWKWLTNVNDNPADGDDEFLYPLISRAYGVPWTPTAVKYGKSIGWTDWTHG